MFCIFFGLSVHPVLFTADIKLVHGGLQYEWHGLMQYITPCHRCGDQQITYLSPWCVVWPIVTVVWKIIPSCLLPRCSWPHSPTLCIGDGTVLGVNRLDPNPL
jgi:hypothetical protein